MFGNLNRVLDARDKQQELRGTEGGYLRKLEDGETVTLRFIGGEDEPYVLDGYHVDRRTRRRNHKHDVYGWAKAHAAELNSKHGVQIAIRGPNPRAAFTVISTRKVHKKIIRRQDGSEGGEYSTCTAWMRRMDPSVSCPGCSSGIPLVEEGRVCMELAITHAARVVEVEKALREDCACRTVCGSGVDTNQARIALMGWECPECGDPINEYNPDQAVKVTCGSCEEQIRPQEIISCEADCGNPRRRSMRDCYVDMTRKGTRLKTEYHFTPRPPSAVEERHRPLLKPLDLRALLKPEDSAQQAAVLGIPDPFGPRDAQQPQQNQPQEDIPW